jgi:hypothetical protein
MRTNSIGADMTKLQELESEVEALPESDYNEFRRWFLERDWAAWDREIEQDAAAGKLDSLINEAKEAKDKETLKAL